MGLCSARALSQTQQPTAPWDHPQLSPRRAVPTITCKRNALAVLSSVRRPVNAFFANEQAFAVQSSNCFESIEWGAGWVVGAFGPGRSNSRAFRGAHGPGYMGLATTTWVPMGGRVPVLSPNDHPKPSPEATKRFQKKSKFRTTHVVDEHLLTPPANTRFEQVDRQSGWVNAQNLGLT